MNSINQVVGKFFRTTTLHGFKYLVSRYNCDRIGWALCCVASACCAGVLCVVLWDRFLEMPALLQLVSTDLSPDVTLEPLPIVAFCQPPEAVAEAFLKHSKTNGKNTTRLPRTLAHALQGKTTDGAQSDLLEELLKLNNVSLLEMLQKYTPECSDLITKCRWRDVFVECTRLFKKEMTSLGVCCVASPIRFSNIYIPEFERLFVIKKLDVGLQTTTSHGIEFFTSYIAGNYMTPTRLGPGFNYFAHVTFASEKDNDIEKLVDGTCISFTGYSKSQCLLKCKEKLCGCSDPFRKVTRQNDDKIAPPCPLRRLSCLRTYGIKEDNSSTTTCPCLPACQKIMMKLVMERGPFKLQESSLDPLYSGLNVTHSVAFRMRINFNLSKFFLLRPTETWLTLLSSLGGVFNMFLGVGLFSALEFLFFTLVKLPIAIRQSTERNAPSKIVLFQRAY